jgi:hypothetical protein
VTALAKRKIESHESTGTAFDAKRLRGSQKAYMCNNCKQIMGDFMKIKLKDLKPKGNPVTSFRYSSQECALCTLFRGYFASEGITDFRPQMLSHAVSFLRTSKLVNYSKCGPEPKRRDIVYLKAVCPEVQQLVFGISRTGQEGFIASPQLLGAKADLARCKDWIHHCQQHHNKRCGYPSASPEHLSVIDCYSSRVVIATAGTRYVALSYVWGTQVTASKDIFPQTVQDAVEVTVALAYQYLWIDRYCIEQDSEAKHQQIRQMDLVYQAADVTIIAAAGTDADSGLPGVSNTPRNQHLEVDLNDYTVLHCPETPYSAIPKTMWYTRAWTLQESFFSRRRLVFTSDQVYYECAAMNCCESLIEDRNFLHLKNQAGVRAWHHSGIFSGTDPQIGYVERPAMPPGHRETNTWISISGLTAEYTSRQLSYDCDSFNAFWGIIKRLQTRDPSLCHIWGLEVRKARDSQISHIHLFWEHDWRSTQPSRRKSFPSWAWVGWRGVFRLRASSYLSLDELLLELLDGTIVPIARLTNLANQSMWDTWSQPVALLWKAYFVDTKRMACATTGHPRQFWINDDRYKALDLKLSVPHSDPVELLNLFRNRMYRLIVGDAQHLLVLKTNGNSYIRIGHADLQIGYYGVKGDAEVIRII